jgi:hypothetical protein
VLNRRQVLVWLLPPIAQCAAMGALQWGRQPYALYAQLVALAIILVVYGALGIQRFRFLRRNYQETKHRRDEHATAFRTFVDAHLSPNPPG